MNFLNFGELCESSDEVYSLTLIDRLDILGNFCNVDGEVEYFHRFFMMIFCSVLYLVFSILCILCSVFYYLYLRTTAFSTASILNVSKLG